MSTRDAGLVMELWRLNGTQQNQHAAQGHFRGLSTSVRVKPLNSLVRQRLRGRALDSVSGFRLWSCCRLAL